MSSKTFKPRTWWTIFRDDIPMPWFVRPQRKSAIEVAVELYGPDETWDQLQARGYTVGKIVVSPFEGPKN